MENWSLHQSAAAAMLLRARAVAFNFTEGFALDIHTTFPEAPRSPYFVSIRTPDNTGEKKGNLTPRDVQLVAHALVSMCVNAGVTFDCVAGVPTAGDPIAQAFARAYPNHPKVLHLEKTGEGGDRRISLKPEQYFSPGLRVLVIDDLITKATTKLVVVQVLRDAGFEVTDVAVLLDRESGAAQDLMAAGITLHASIVASDLFRFARLRGQINDEQLEVVMSYPEKLQSYIASEDGRRRVMREMEQMGAGHA